MSGVRQVSSGDGQDDPDPSSEPPRWELDLPGPAGQPSNLATPALPGPPRPHQPWPADDDDSLDGLGAGGGTDFELSEPALAPALGRRAFRSSPRSGRDSGRSIQVRRHSVARRPAHGGLILLGVVWVALVTLAAPFIHPEGVTLLGLWLGKLAWLPYAAAGVAVFVAWAIATAKALALGSVGLGLSSLGSMALLACLGLVASSILGGSSTLLAFRAIMPMAAPLCAAAVTLGLGAFALRRAGEELRQPDRRVLYALLLALLGLGGLAVGLRTARVDLPLPRIGQSYELVPWAPVPID